MIKRTLCFLFLLAAGFTAFAGDVARFVDLGFSQDGNVYFFGQYGKTDKTFLPYAEIYAVDVKKNDFIQVFKTTGTSRTQNGTEIFDELKAKHINLLSAYNTEPVPVRQMLYLRENENRTTQGVLEFTDFEHSTVDNPLHYSVTLVPYTETTGKTVKSSFYIVIERKHRDGTIIGKTVAGNPAIKREGVTGYRIEKIYSNTLGNSLAIVVEKTLIDDNGVSVRYMIETVYLN
jgi:predicted secreted protein